MILYRLWKEGLFRRIDREKILFFLGMTPTPLLLSRREPLIRKVHWLRALLSPGVDATTADAVHVLIEGAIAAAAAHVDTWPIRAALRAAEKLIGQAD